MMMMMVVDSNDDGGGILGANDLKMFLVCFFIFLHTSHLILIVIP